MISLSHLAFDGKKSVSPPRPARFNSVSSRCVSSNDQKSTTKVAIVEDDENDRRLMRQDLEKTGEFVCVGSYGSPYEALAEIPKVRPDVVLMDIRMPGMDGLECTRRLKAHMVQLRVIIVTGLLDIDSMNNSLQAGADGYLTKPASRAQFLATLKLIVRDGLASGDKLHATRLTSGRQADSPKIGLLLTVRENQVMTFLSKGLLSKQIPDELGISFSAVHKHQINAYRKLAAHNRTEALNNWRDDNHP